MTWWVTRARPWTHKPENYLHRHCHCEEVKQCPVVLLSLSNHKRTAILSLSKEEPVNQRLAITT